jgi:hypothetical protein
LAFLSPIPISFSKSSTLALLMSIFLLAIITANHLYILKLTKNINLLSQWLLEKQFMEALVCMEF